MTAKEFLQNKPLTAIEKTDKLIINLIIGEETYGMDVDTLEIESGTPLEKITDFEINGDLLTAGGITINLAEINIL